MDDGLTVQVVSVDGTTTVYVAGEIDVANADRLARLICEEADLHPRAILVDTAGVEFIGSTGLRALLIAQHHARAVGVHFLIARPSVAMTRLVAMVGGDVLDIDETQTELSTGD